MPRLSMQGIAKAFPGVQALDDVSFEAEAGEIHALIGENGAGKSTLIKILGGAHTPDRGTVTIDGTPLPFGDPVGAMRAGVQVIYQELTLVPELTVAENIFLGREKGRFWLERAEMERAAQRILNGLGAEVSARDKVAGLSVAEQQLVEIARALSVDSKVIVLDEPTSTLPDPEVRRLFEVLRDLRDRGLAIIYISHRLEEIFELTDRISVLRDGKEAGHGATADVDRAQLIRWMVGRDLEEEFPPRAPHPGPVILEANGIAAPGRFTDVSFDVREGEIVGLAGLVGSGRTSVGLSLVGALPYRGELLLDGLPAKWRNPRGAIRAGLGYIPEDRKRAGIFPWLTTGDNITVSFLSNFSSFGVLSLGELRRKAESARQDFTVRSAGLGQRAGTLSGGNQQKLLLARYLLEPRRLLILDEPTRGIDVGAKAEIYRLMNRLTDQGLGIVMISSELPEILGMSDRVVVLREGRSVGTLTRDDATQERIMELATGGGEAA